LDREIAELSKCLNDGTGVDLDQRVDGGAVHRRVERETVIGENERVDAQVRPGTILEGRLKTDFCGGLHQLETGEKRSANRQAGVRCDGDLKSDDVGDLAC